MNTPTVFQRQLASAISICVLAITGCGGDLAVPSEGGSGSVPPDRLFVAVGPITKLSPLTVNGVEFSTGGSTIVIDADDDDRKGLQVGMVARVSARSRPTGGPIQALSVVTGAELRGPVTAIDTARKTFAVAGIPVEIDANTSFDDLASGFDSLTEKSYVQIHGFPSGSNRLRATLVKQRAAQSTVKITANVDAGPCDLCAVPGRDFPLAGFAVLPVTTGVNDPGSAFAPSAGALVTVIAQTTNTPGVLQAQQVASYSRAAAPADGSAINVQGIYAPVAQKATEARFTVSGLVVNVDASTSVADSKFGITLSPGNLLEIGGDIKLGEVKAATVQPK